MIKQPKRSVQHKPTREERKKNQDTQDLKAENRMLRKQLARMRKEAQKPEIVKYEAVLAPPEFEVEKCSTCDGINIGKMTMPTGSILTVCKGCGKRASTGKKIE